MEWLLVVISLGAGQPLATTVGPFNSEDLCNVAADKIGQAKVRYRDMTLNDSATLVCVRAK